MFKKCREKPTDHLLTTSYQTMLFIISRPGPLSGLIWTKTKDTRKNKIQGGRKDGLLTVT